MMTYLENMHILPVQVTEMPSISHLQSKEGSAAGAAWLQKGCPGAENEGTDCRNHKFTVSFPLFPSLIFNFG